MRRAATAVIALAVLSLTGCSSGGPPPLLKGDTGGYLLKLDQFASPDFAVQEPVTKPTAATLAGSNKVLAAAATTDGFAEGATVRYFRSAGSFATSNGPIDVIDTAIRFNTVNGAHDWWNLETQARDTGEGVTELSTGALGDEGHSTTQTAEAPGGTTAVQIIVEWRHNNVVSILTVRGRYGGTRLDDVLFLAHHQDANIQT